MVARKVAKDQTDQESISHLREILADFTESAAIAERKAAEWGKKAYLIAGRCWLIHEEDGTPKAVLVALTAPPPFRYQHVKEGFDWAVELNVPLSVVAGDAPAYNVPAAELQARWNEWKPYVGPAGLVLDPTI